MNGTVTVSVAVIHLCIESSHVESKNADFKYNAHMYFGKRYKFEDVKVDWHIPGEDGKLCMLETKTMLLTSMSCRN